jgi:hypothetical protein
MDIQHALVTLCATNILVARVILHAMDTQDVLATLPVIRKSLRS